jgi:nucleoside-diphosphate-sugar epimerase
MQTILGSGGAIGKDLAKALTAYTKDIRLVSRHPEKINETDELMAADLLSAEETDRAIAGSEVVYLVVGLKYEFRVWQEQWPVVMDNVLTSCHRHGAKLVFFDNIYMIDREHIGHLTEESPIRPSSKKGFVRAQLVHMINDAVQEGEVEVIIARSADFYGPGVGNSVLQETVLKPLKNGKRANFLASPQHVHTYTYTPDAARATAQLGNTPSAYNQTWNLPTTKEQLTGKDWLQLIANELGVPPRSVTIPGFVLSLAGLFSPMMREVKEMNYQYERDYIFDSSKFEAAFGWSATDPEAGIRSVVAEG